MDLHTLVEKGVKKAHELGASEAEIYIVRRVSLSLAASGRGVEKLESGEALAVSVRIVVGKRISNQGALISSEKDLDNLILNTIKVAKTLPEDPQWISLPKRYGYTQCYDIIDNKLYPPKPEMFMELAKYSLIKPNDIDKRASIANVRVGGGYTVRAIGNSYNDVVTSEKTSFYFSIEVKAVNGDKESSYIEYYWAPTTKEFNIDRVIGDTVDISIKTLGAKQIETGKYQVILTPRVFSEVISTLIVPAIRADWVQKKRSPLRGKLHSEIFSENLTIIDDGAAPNMSGTNPFDDEGIATQRKTVFDRGVLTTYLYDTYTANIDGKESTGNAVKSGLGSATYPDATNIIVLPSASSLDAMMRDIRRGIVVYSTIGGWLSNPVNGYLNATIVNSLYIENGKILYPVKGVVITGNIYELLSKNLIALSKEVKHYGNYITPYVMLDNTTIAGK